MKSIYVLLLIVVGGCATLLPIEQRRVEIIKPVKADKNTAYKRGLAYLAKNQGDAKAVMQVQDEAGGQIITRIAVRCAELDQPLDPSNYYLHFTLDFQMKDNKVRFIFEDLQTKTAEGSVALNDAQISTADAIAKSKKCLSKLSDEIVSSVDGPKSTW